MLFLIVEFIRMACTRYIDAGIGALVVVLVFVAGITFIPATVFVIVVNLVFGTG